MMEDSRGKVGSTGFSATAKPWAERSVWKAGEGHLTEGEECVGIHEKRREEGGTY